jgi:hypothetical protein
MATWNVRTMLIPGKMEEISNEVMNYKIDRYCITRDMMARTR